MGLEHFVIGLLMFVSFAISFWAHGRIDKLEKSLERLINILGQSHYSMSRYNITEKKETSNNGNS